MPGPDEVDPQQARRDDLERNLQAVRKRIAAAARAGDRPEPALIVVTKFHPADDVRTLASLGVADFGENRDQEAAAKAAVVGRSDLRWHFIGQLQSNKARSVASYAHAVHSVDRASLAAALSRAMVVEQDRTGRSALECFIQVNLDPAAANLHAGGRGGAISTDVPHLAHTITELPGLRLAGVMAVAPLGADADDAFARLAEISATLMRDFPAADAISAGMSHDLEQAVRHGATHLRVGSDVLGPRPTVR